MLTLFATALGSAVAFLDTTVVVVALPRMEDDLGHGPDGPAMGLPGLRLSLSAFYLVGGAIGDRVGLRRTFVVGVVLFAAASLVTALAPGEGVLIAGRALQGVGGAVLTTTSLALLRVTWAGEAGRAIGLWTSLTSIATIGGPPLGGLIVQAVSWRWVFLINVPLAVVTIALAVAGRGDAERTQGRATLDLVGSSLVALGLTGLSYALVEVRDRGLAHVLPMLVVGVLALAALVIWTRRSADPARPSGAPPRAGPRRRQPRHARALRSARSPPAVRARVPAVHRAQPDALRARVRAACPGARAARPARGTLRRPPRAAAADRRGRSSRSASRCSCPCP